MSRRLVPLCSAVLVVILGLASPDADADAAGVPRWWVGFGGGAFSPQGALAGHAGLEGAYELFVAHRLTADAPWGVRLTAQAVEIARNDTTYALPGIDVRTRTSSQLAWITLGPQFQIGRGPVSALAHAGVGGAWAITRTALLTSTNDIGNTHRQRAAVALEAGAALSWDVLRAREVRVELGGRWLHTGSLEYVPESGLRRAAGTLVLTPREDVFQGLVWRGALVLGLGGGRRPR